MHCPFLPTCCSEARASQFVGAWRFLVLIRAVWTLRGTESRAISELNVNIRERLAA